MNTQLDSVQEFRMDAQAIDPATTASTRPLYWSVRRELWENRSIYIAPLAVAAFVFFGFMFSTIGMPSRRRALLTHDLAYQRAAIGESYGLAAMMLILTAAAIGVFYCLDALYGERRDRSILFWKSLPVSDRITVFSKTVIPLVILPAVTFAIIVATQFLMLLWSTVVLLPSGLGGTTWSRFNLIVQSIILLYGLITLALWHAPIYGWLLLVSAWARRAALLWAILPLFAIVAIEKVALNSTHFANLLKNRVIGHFSLAFSTPPLIDSLSQLTPGSFLAAPGLWLGLIVAALFLAGAVRLRRYRDPI